MCPEEGSRNLVQFVLYFKHGNQRWRTYQISGIRNVCFSTVLSQVVCHRILTFGAVWMGLPCQWEELAGVPRPERGRAKDFIPPPLSFYLSPRPLMSMFLYLFLELSYSASPMATAPTPFWPPYALLAPSG